MRPCVKILRRAMLSCPFAPRTFFASGCKEPDSNVAFEYRLTLEALNRKTKRILPIRVWGEAAEAVPPALQGLDVYDHE